MGHMSQELPDCIPVVSFNIVLYSLYFLPPEIYYYFRFYYFSVRIFQINCIIFITRWKNKAKKFKGTQRNADLANSSISAIHWNSASRSIFRIQARLMLSHTGKMFSVYSWTDLFFQTNSIYILSPSSLLPQW